MTRGRTHTNVIFSDGCHRSRDSRVLFVDDMSSAAGGLWMLVMLGWVGMDDFAASRAG